MKNNEYLLRFYINGYYEYKQGTLDELQPWIDVCNEESISYVLFNSANQMVGGR